MSEIKIEPLNQDILAYDMYFGEQKTSSGIILMDDDKTDRGIHPRWAKVYAVGPKNKTDLQPGHWILIEHGRWSRGIDMSEIDPNIDRFQTIVRRIDPKAILGYTTVDPNPSIGSFVGPIGAK
jgi:co-chaperonin GroES (HSP10)